MLQEAGAIRECEKHGWMQDRADPHTRERAFVIARQDSLNGFSPEEAVAEVRDVLDSIGGPCPECRQVAARPLVRAWLRATDRGLGRSPARPAGA